MLVRYVRSPPPHTHSFSSFVWFPLALAHSAHSFTRFSRLKKGTMWIVGGKEGKRRTHPRSHWFLPSHSLSSLPSLFLVQMREKTNQNRWGRVVGEWEGERREEKSEQTQGNELTTLALVHFPYVWFILFLSYHSSHAFASLVSSLFSFVHY